MNEHRVAVVGGGIFGVTAATKLARMGYPVVLFEQAGELLSLASRVNQRRLHRGYHYPRSKETATSARSAVESFVAEYGPAVHDGYAHYVAIARWHSLVTADQYIAFCDEVGLRYRQEFPPFLRRSSVEVSLRVEESLIDVDELRRLCEAKLAAAGVEVRLRARASRWDLMGFEHVVLATYAALNELHPKQAEAPSYQFEVCEKPLVQLPARYAGCSLVVMDGPFMCLDPIVATDKFLLGNVDHGIHATTVGRFPLLPRTLADYVDTGLVKNPPSTRFREFVASARKFLKGFDQAQHIGSYFTVRTVLPSLEATDARPTLVWRLDDRTIALLGGKITTCVGAAREVASMLTPTMTHSTTTAS